MSKALALANLTPDNIPALRSQNYLVLSPTDQIAQINPFFAIRLSHVAVNVEVDQWKNAVGPDIWKVPGGGAKYAPTKVLLNKIAAAAGIEWDLSQTKRMDNMSNRFFCAYRAVGKIRLPSGEVRQFMDEATEDAETIREEIFEKWLAKVEEGQTYEKWETNAQGKRFKTDVPMTPEYAEAKASAEFRQYHKFMPERCLSRAMNRAIRQVLALNGTYTIPELEKGFIVPQVNLSPDWNNPEIAALAQRAIAGSFSGMFGEQQPKGLEASEGAVEIAQPAPVLSLEAGESEEEVAARFGEAPPMAVEAQLVEQSFGGQRVEEEEEELDLEAGPINDRQVQQLGIKCGEFFGTKKADAVAAREWISKCIGREIQSRTDLTFKEAMAVLRIMDQSETLADLWGAVNVVE